MKQSKIYKVALASVFAAMSAVFVGFFHIPNAIGGYIHLGEAIVYLASAILPLPYAALSTAIGFAAADMIGGYFYYMLPSALIRVAVAMLFKSKGEKILTKRNVTALPFALIITVGGYFIFKYFMYAFIQKTPEIALTSAVTSIPGNIIQCVAGSAVFLVAGAALDKINFKEKLFGGKDNV